jgi:hypothetical protein
MVRAVIEEINEDPEKDEEGEDHDEQLPSSLTQGQTLQSF